MALAIALEILAEVENRGGYLSRSQVDALKAALSERKESAEETLQEIDGWKKVLVQAKSDLETGFIPSAHGRLMDLIHALPHSLIANHLPPAGKRVSESDLASMPTIQAVSNDEEGVLRLAQSALRQWTDLYAHLQNECGEVLSRKLDYNLPPANHLKALEAIEEALKTLPSATMHIPHDWQPDGGKVTWESHPGGEAPHVHTTCSKCGARAWFLEYQWELLSKGCGG